ncbi:unnamed protein product [Rotaria sp. Silwood1]|nr:unnamed protein product [Rotaria sp. Silwood1]CAF3361076.1 unnamed protein product [Rotaria sp. Silwood1]CAF3384704.1 unnamed protein product [Rotaria sp. Silwood1]CAF4612551.1 unnamed protein product [Rotaria sp. Silwood1]CAF4650534.1 unnamed protein product [Rotaria sp. Silwood1]
MPIAEDRVEQLQMHKLIYAVRTDDILLVHKLSEKGVKNLVNYNDPQNGLTALIAAVTENNTNMIKCLLQLDAHPDVIDFSGRTALMHAAEYGYVTVLQLLREADADARIQDFEGNATEHHKTCLKILLEMGANVNNRTQNSVPNLVHICNDSVEYEDFCMALILAGADVQLIDEKTKRTALHNACLSGSTKIVRELLRMQADPNALDDKKSTPAHEAAKGGHFQVIRILSGFGAKFDVYDTLGNNPIHYAVMSNAGTAIRYLGQRGCNPKKPNLEGLIPKQIAHEYGNKDVQRSLRKAERGYHEMTANLPADEFLDWRIILYDYIYENYERIEKLFQEFDMAEPKNGIILKDNFKKVLNNENFLSFLKPYNIKDLYEKHDKSREELDYRAFLTGTKYLAKPYLMTAYTRKKKKKKV